MRLKCEYKTDALPVTYRMMFVSLVKQALQFADLEYFNKLYRYKNKTNKRSKNFCFSVYLKGFDKQENIFKINDKVVLYLSSPDSCFILNVYNGLIKIKEFKYKNFQLQKQRIDVVREKRIVEDELVCKTMSPIYIKDKKNNVISPYDKNYQKELNYISNVILQNYRGNGLQQELNFMPIKFNKQVVKENIRRYEDLTGKKYLYLNGYSGIFKLKGITEDLRDLYMLGLGFRRNQGFGMIEVV